VTLALFINVLIIIIIIIIIIIRWNSLPEEAIQVDSINSFKKHLLKIYSTKMGLFLD